ncbi:hypothetical protein O6P43_002544 [Quillaja saponaria]|uniref:Uncharacterized protein n=1 Tax=Quillaja saponaria TaxID=32244 RepID=A0AAD7QD55_QUISA|nr:hypothetical protein O6P43_002544 [Quillaja saponaria]
MARVKSRSQNPLDWRGFSPAAIRSEYFNELCETTWNTEEWKHKSAAAMKNRSSMPEASVRVGGSRTFVRHKEIMWSSQRRVEFMALVVLLTLVIHVPHLRPVLAHIQLVHHLVRLVSEEHFLSIMQTEMRTELRTEIQTQNQEIRSYVDNALKGVVDAIKQLTTSFSQSSRARGHQKGKAKGKYRRQAVSFVSIMKNRN